MLAYWDGQGTQWVNISLPNLPPQDDIDLKVNVEVSPAVPQNLYIYLTYGLVKQSACNCGGIFYRFDGQSATFLSVTPDQADPGKQGFAVSPVNPSIIYYGDLQIFGSQDGGNNLDKLSQ